MPTPRERLIRIFGEHPVEGIDDVPALAELVREREGDRVFQREYARTERIKRLLENTAGRQADSYRDQVAFALRTVARYREDPDDLATCRALVERAYAPSWSQAQRDFFAETCDTLARRRYDYFLSFTNRASARPLPRDPDENPINLNYKTFIITSIGEDRYERADKVRKNLLARALHRLLSQDPYNLSGFFYEDHGADSATVEQELAEGCNTCHAFVQLVQNSMFLRDRPNYCHFEFEQVEAARPRPDYLFLFAAPDRETFLEVHDVLDPPFGPWHGVVAKKRMTPLPYARSAGEVDRIDALHQLVKNLSVSVEQARKRLFEDVPI